MIIRIEYNKNTKEITLTKDDDIIVEINESETVDNDNELKTMLTDVMAKLQHIEILLASNQIKQK